MAPHQDRKNCKRSYKAILSPAKDDDDDIKLDLKAENLKKTVMLIMQQIAVLKG